MWGLCSPTITAKSILIKTTTEGETHKKCKEIERKKVGVKEEKDAEKEKKKMTEKDKYKITSQNGEDGIKTTEPKLSEC